jgi:Flp pilus assembly pilin Flp
MFSWVRGIVGRAGALMDRRAVTSLEYGIIAGIIVVTVLSGFANVGSNMQKKFNNVAAKIGT